MSSVSPGDAEPSSFQQVLPGAPVPGFQSTATLTFRWKRYLFYISKQQLNILRSQNELVQILDFEEQLLAVIAEPTESGRVALATASSLYILKPVTSAWHRVTWAKELRLDLDHQTDSNGVQCLSWSCEGELLVGSGQHLSLFSTTPGSQPSTPAAEDATASTETRKALWTQTVASPLQFARFSPSANLFATTAVRDRLVKIWRRLSFEEAIFDFAYLPHEGAVTYLEWRPHEPEKLVAPLTDQQGGQYGSDEQCEVLFTMATDAQLRIWRTGYHHDLDMLSLYTIIDLVSAIPHSPVLQTRSSSAVNRPARYAFILPSFAYCSAASVLLKKQPQGKLRHSLEHIREVISREPDVVVTIDAQGRMSAWGVSSIGHKRRPGSSSGAVASPFHIAHSDDMGLHLDGHPVPAAFDTWFEGDVLNVLMHSFEHGIRWWQGKIEDFSSSSAISEDRGHVTATLAGASSTISGMQASSDLRTMFTWTNSGELRLWTDTRQELKPQISAQLQEPVLAADTVQRGKSVLVLSQGSLTLIRDDGEQAAHKHPLHASARLTLSRIENAAVTADEGYLIYSETGDYCVVSVNPTRSDWTSKAAVVDVSERATRLNLIGVETQVLSHVRALVHPRKAGWLRIVALADAQRIIRRDVKISPEHGPGRDEAAITFNLRSPAGLLVATPNFAAAVGIGGRTLSVVDLKDGYVEHEATLQTQVKSVLFSRPAFDEISLTHHTLLAVSYTDKVDVLARTKHSRDQTQWHAVKTVSIADVGVSISNIEWLPNSRLALAAGSSMMITNDWTSTKHLSTDTQQALELASTTNTRLSELQEHFGSPEVCWNARGLRILVALGHFQTVVKVLDTLQANLRFYTNGDQLDSMLGLDPLSLLNMKPIPHESDYSELIEQLDELDLPYTSDAEQAKLKLVVRAISYLLRHISSLDKNAIKFLFSWRYRSLDLADQQEQQTEDPKANGVALSTQTVPTMSWRDVVFAYRSKTQQPLMEILVQHYENKLDWTTVRRLGITLWLHNVRAAQSEGAAMASLEQVFDALGQSAYRATHPPNPAESSLYLLALRKKAVLLSLWRIAIGNREQKSTMNFLKRDFTVEENKVAARKNAYALMGKRRFEYAAAFFLLADDIQNAVSLLAGQCDDLPLAVAVARAYCGDNTSIANAFLQDRVVPTAQKDGNRWMLHWAYHISGQFGTASRALVSPFDAVMGEAGEAAIRTWRQDDPAATVTYAELRDASLRSVSAKQQKVQVSSNDEYRAVLRSARILRRQGYWLMALNLASCWSFVNDQPGSDVVPLQKQAPIEAVNGDASSSLLDSFGALSTNEKASDEVSADVDKAGVDQDDAQARAAKAAELLAKMRAKKAGQAGLPGEDASQTEQKTPTQFKEPTASSLLDNFGF